MKRISSQNLTTEEYNRRVHLLGLMTAAPLKTKRERQKRLMRMPLQTPEEKAFRCAVCTAFVWTRFEEWSTAGQPSPRYWLEWGLPECLLCDGKPVCGEECALRYFSHYPRPNLTQMVQLRLEI